MLKNRACPCRYQPNSGLENINVYTDGSWLFPLKQFLGLGGAGVWWKDRTCTKQYNIDNNCNLELRPLSTAERQMTHVEQSKDGLRSFSKIGGFGGSSTRTELAAGIIAICAYGAVHIGSDSEAFVNKANQYMNDINNGIKTIKPWKLINDGDLWEHFYKAVETKGTQAIQITWVKGHATQEHIDKGISNETDMQGTYEADITADRGTELHGKDLIKIAGNVHARHEA